MFPEGGNGVIQSAFAARAETLLAAVVLSLLSEGCAADEMHVATAEREHMDFNLAAISADFKIKSPEPFDQKYMRTLYDTGYRARHSGYRWMKAPPGLGSGLTTSVPRAPQASSLPVPALN